MAKLGAKPKYETLVKPYLDDIRAKVRQGVTEAAIADALGISVASLNNYKKQHPELAEALSKDKGADVLQSLVNSGLDAAQGRYVENTQTFYRIDEDGNPVIERVVVTKQWQPPNPALHKFYVMNFGKEEGYSNDPLAQELRRKKQEFDEALERQRNWHLDI